MLAWISRWFSASSVLWRSRLFLIITRESHTGIYYDLPRHLSNSTTIKINMSLINYKVFWQQDMLFNSFSRVIKRHFMSSDDLLKSITWNVLNYFANIDCPAILLYLTAVELLTGVLMSSYRTAFPEISIRRCYWCVGAGAATGGAIQFSFYNPLHNIKLPSHFLSNLLNAPSSCACHRITEGGGGGESYSMSPPPWAPKTSADSASAFTNFTDF